MTTEVDTLESLKERLAQLESARTRDEQLKSAEHDLLTFPPAPKATGLGAELQAAQDEALRARRAAHEEFQRRYAEQQAAAAPRLAKLRGELADVGKRRQAEDARHAAALQDLAAESRPLTAKVAELERVPAMPAIDTSHAAVLARDALSIEQALGAPQGPPANYRRARVLGAGKVL